MPVPTPSWRAGVLTMVQIPPNNHERLAKSIFATAVSRYALMHSPKTHKYAEYADLAYCCAGVLIADTSRHDTAL